MEKELDNNVQFPPKNKNFIKSILIWIFILFVLIFGLKILFNGYFQTSNILSSLLVHPIDSKKIISNTRHISDVPDNADKLLNTIGLKNKHISGSNQDNKGIIKTDNNRFWFFRVGPNDCVEFCNFQNYMIDTQNKTVSDLNVNDALFEVNPIGDSIITIQDQAVPYDGKGKEIYKYLIYDASKNEVIDEINPSNNIDYIRFGSNNYLAYSQNNVLHVRDIQKHTSIKVGRLYNYLYNSSKEQDNPFDHDKPFIFSNNKDFIYALMYVNDEPLNPINYNPTKDDPLKLIKFNLKDNSSSYVTDKLFNFPFYFNTLNSDKIFIGGGHDNNGLITYPSYIVDISTGKTQMIYSGPTDYVLIDNIKSIIEITASFSRSEKILFNFLGQPVDNNGNVLNYGKYYIPNTNYPVTVYPLPPSQHVEKLVVAKFGQPINVANSSLTVSAILDEGNCINIYKEYCTSPTSIRAINSWISEDNKKINANLDFTLGLRNINIGNNEVYLKEVKIDKPFGQKINKNDYKFIFSITKWE